MSLTGTAGPNFSWGNQSHSAFSFLLRRYAFLACLFFLRGGALSIERLAKKPNHHTVPCDSIGGPGFAPVGAELRSRHLDRPKARMAA